MKKHYSLQGRIEQVAPATFKAIVTAACTDRAFGESESVESYASSSEEATRLLVGLAATLTAAIRMRGDQVEGLAIAGKGHQSSAAD